MDSKGQRDDLNPVALEANFEQTKKGNTVKQQSNRIDKVISKIKNNPVVSSVIVLGTIIIALATFSDAVENLLNLISKDRPKEARAELARLNLEYTPEVFLKTVEMGDVHGVKLFLIAGMDPNSEDNHGITPLMYAVWKDHPQIFGVLLKANANVNEKNDRGATALGYAAAHERGIMLRALLKKDVNAETVNDAFITAAKNGNLDSLRILLDGGADIGKVGAEALIGASGSISSDTTEKVVGFLLELGVEVNTKNKDGWAPLHGAVFKGHLSVVRTLLDGGANVNAKCECRQYLDGGWTPLLLAVENRRYEIVKELLDRGADVNAKENRGKTALMLAKYYDAGPDIVQVLLDRGADGVK